MAQSKSRNLKVQLSDGGMPEVFNTISLAQSKSITIDNPPIEARTDDDNGWSNAFPEGAVTTVSISATHIFSDNADHLSLVGAAIDKGATGPQVRARIIDLDAGVSFTGDWQITNYSLEGSDPEGFVTASIELQGLGPVTVSGAL